MEIVDKCQWALKTSLEEIYHDEEWGVPIYDDQKLFELLSLELCQSGLSWHTILSKREGYLVAFSNFNIKEVSGYGKSKIEELLQDTGIIRHRAKISAIINNANCIIDIQGEYGSFSDYLWGFVENKSIVGCWKSESDIPVSTDLSTKMSKDMKEKGFKFIGTTTLYAFMQSVGIVNDHTIGCFRFEQVNDLRRL